MGMDSATTGKSTPPSTLTLEKLEQIARELRAKRVFYMTSEYCPKYNDQGGRFCAKFPTSDGDVYLFHPYHLGVFMVAMISQGITPIEYNLYLHLLGPRWPGWLTTRE